MKTTGVARETERWGPEALRQIREERQRQQDAVAALTLPWGFANSPLEHGIEVGHHCDC